MASTFPGAPGNWWDCRAGKLSCPGSTGTTPQYTGTHRQLWGLDILPLFNIFLYHIQSCVYSTTAVTRVDMSCHEMLNSLLLPQSLILLLFPAVPGTTVPFVWICFEQLGLRNMNAYISPLSFSYHSQQAQLEFSHNRLSLWKSSICDFLVWSPYSSLCTKAPLLCHHWAAGRTGLSEKMTAGYEVISALHHCLLLHVVIR